MHASMQRVHRASNPDPIIRSGLHLLLCLHAKMSIKQQTPHRRGAITSTSFDVPTPPTSARGLTARPDAHLPTAPAPHHPPTLLRRTTPSQKQTTLTELGHLDVRRVHTDAERRDARSKMRGVDGDHVRPPVRVRRDLLRARTRVLRLVSPPDEVEREASEYEGREDGERDPERERGCGVVGGRGDRRG